MCVNGSPRRPSRSSFQSDSGQLRATGHHLSPAAASSSTIGRRQTALPYAVVIDQQAALFERLASRFWKSCNRCDLTSRLINSLAKIKQMFKSDTVNFERRTIILDQPRHQAGTSCVDRLLCPILSSLIRMSTCLRDYSQPSFSVRVPRCGLISRLINVLVKSTKMVNSNSQPSVCSFLTPRSFRTLVCVCGGSMSLCLFVGGCLWGWVCGCMFSVDRVCVYVGLCFCVYSRIQTTQSVPALVFSERCWSASSNRPSSYPSRGIEQHHRASTDCSALCCRHRSTGSVVREGGLTILEVMQQMRLDLQTHQLLSQDQADVQERQGQLRTTDHHLRPAAASSRHIVCRQTALPYAVVIDQDVNLFERLQSTFVFSSCAKMRVISRLINVLVKSTKMVNSNSQPRVCSFLTPRSFRTLVCVCV